MVTVPCATSAALGHVFPSNLSHVILCNGSETQDAKFNCELSSLALLPPGRTVQRASSYSLRCVAGTSLHACEVFCQHDVYWLVERACMKCQPISLTIIMRTRLKKLLCGDPCPACTKMAVSRVIVFTVSTGQSPLSGMRATCAF
eukprot:1386321-Rhodomonas_salina.2